MSRYNIIYPNDTLNNITLPQNQPPILCSTQDLSISKLSERVHITQLDLTEFGDLSLELQSRECLCNFPELYMTHTSRPQEVGVMLGELYSVDLLGECLGLQENVLLLPIPDTYQIVRARTDRC